jgi:hypothetical protein
MKPKPTINWLKALAPFYMMAVLLLNVRCVNGQVQAVPDTTVQKTHWYHAIRLRFPEFIFDRVFVIKDHSLVNFPDAMGLYMYPVKGGFQYIVPATNNWNFRLIGLFYKDRIGLELYTGGYGGKTDYQPFLQAKFPNYYGSKEDNVNNPYDSENRYYYWGWQYGLAYKHHWKGFVLEPKFILGLEKLRSATNSWIMKEKGSNQFTEYEVFTEDSRKRASYRLQMRLAKRFYIKSENPWWVELGVKTEYAMAAKSNINMHVVETPYGKPPIEQDVVVPIHYRSFAVGLFFTVYLKNAHIVGRDGVWGGK